MLETGGWRVEVKKDNKIIFVVKRMEKTGQQSRTISKKGSCASRNIRLIRPRGEHKKGDSNSGIRNKNSTPFCAPSRDSKHLFTRRLPFISLFRLISEKITVGHTDMHSCGRTDGLRNLYKSLRATKGNGKNHLEITNPKSNMMEPKIRHAKQKYNT